MRAITPAIWAMTQPTPEQASAAGRWATLLLVLVLLSIVLIAGLVLLVLARRRTREQRRRESSVPSVDAWAEAGRRATVADSPDGDPV